MDALSVCERLAPTYLYPSLARVAYPSANTAAAAFHDHVARLALVKYYHQIKNPPNATERESVCVCERECV